MKVLVLLYVLFSVNQSFSQAPDQPHFCGEHEARERLLNTSALKTLDSIEQSNFQSDYDSFFETWSPDDRSVFTIPVVVHVVHINGNENISNEQIHNAIKLLNEDFSTLNSDLANTVPAFQGIIGNGDIEFKLATKDPAGNCHSGITRTLSGTTYDNGMSWGGGINHPIVDAVAQQHGIWPQNRYMSIFVCIDPSGNAGYTYRPSNAFPGSQMYGAIFMRHDYMGVIGTSTNSHRHTLAHEAGHWLNLAHLWGNTNEPNIPSNCNGDDGVSDTPNTIGWQGCNTAGVTCGSLDNVQNIMEYSYCSTMFTQGQVARMHFALQSSVAGRNNLSTFSNLQAAGVDVPNNDICAAEYSTTSKIICAGDTIQFSDISVHNITSRSWTFSGGFPASSNDSTVAVTYSVPGEYTVSLMISNGINNETITQTNIIKVLNPIGIEIPYFQGFEDIDPFPDNVAYSIDNPYQDNTWEIDYQNASSGSNSLVLQNYNTTVESTDAFVSGTIDLSVLDPDDDFVLSFKYAYKKKIASNDEWLKVFASYDCGQTWFLRKAIHGNIVGNQVQSSYYQPSPEDWKTITITNINSNFYVSNFRYKIEFQSDLGNNIYIDDINLSSPIFTDISEKPIETAASLYPNPAQNISYLNLVGYAGQRVDVEIYSLTGGKIMDAYSGRIESINETIPISTNQLSKGLYLIRVNGEHINTEIKFIKQ